MAMAFLEETFSSYAEFEEKFRKFKEETFSAFRKKTTEKADKANLKTVAQIPTETFLYSRVQFTCTHYGQPRYRGTGVKKQIKYLATGCQASFILKYDYYDKLYRIVKGNVEHNHPTNPETYAQEYQVKRLKGLAPHAFKSLKLEGVETMADGGSGETVWFQKEITIAPKKRGCHYISKEICSSCSGELSRIKIGTAHIHVKHTSASITVQENFDSTVLTDMEMVLNKIVPENLNYKHDAEGPDDMPAHAKAALIGSSVTVPITNGKFNLGTWQGIWLCEHRDHGGPRKLVVTMNGLKK